jgi:3D (Asp-Asp-Asp) domain-containing protein
MPSRKFILKIPLLLLFLFSLPLLAETPNPVLLSYQKEVFFENNTILAQDLILENKALENKSIKIFAIITGYSSTEEETDNTPFLTASGKTVQEGMVANNFFPFGTKIKIPELFGEKIFVVEDRMKKDKLKSHFDVWFDNKEKAKNFGLNFAWVEIVE